MPLLEASKPPRESNRYRPPARAALALADGRVFRGDPFGAPVDAEGEAVFTTTMTGYQEVCTDPSFYGQIVCMTYPLIGNYGTNGDDNESRRPWIAGLVVREVSATPSNWRSAGTISAYLERHGIPGVSRIDTRALTRHIRSVGDTRAILSHNAADLSDNELAERAQRAVLPAERTAVEDVAKDGIETYPGDGPHIVVVDCGVKQNIIRSLLNRGASVTTVPYGTPFADIAALHPHGVVVSPGPGDPANLDAGLDVVRGLLASRTPYFGICLGHQLLARAVGAETTKLKFGHRGGNHPVKDVATGLVSITAQNHGFKVVEDTLPADSGWQAALVNLNDGSVEGLVHDELPVLSVQFHPEAAPGPRDNADLFDQFLHMISASAAQGSPTA